jgi:hypothetical protein
MMRFSRSPVFEVGLYNNNVPAFKNLLLYLPGPSPLYGHGRHWFYAVRSTGIRLELL